MTLIKIPEDGLFLTDQRTDREGYMAGEDKAFADKQERMNKRKTAEEKLHVRLLEEQCKRTYDSVPSSSMPLELPSKFLTETDIEQWEENEHFQKAKQCAQSLRVVNDVAERGVKLIQDFTLSISRNEEQKQYLLQVVSEHRAQFPEAKKSVLLQRLQQS